MKYKLMLDENNYIEGFVHMDNEEDIYELNASEMKLDHLNCYKLVDNKIIFDENKYNTEINKESIRDEIIMLKTELSATDYQAIKYAEGWFTEEEYAPIKIKRESLREQIRTLESNI